MQVAIVVMHDDMERITFVGRKRVKKRMVLYAPIGRLLFPYSYLSCET
jgi:hypothetical protein